MMTLKSFRGDVKRISVVIPMLLAAFTANAQQPWTLDDCLQYARENNIDLQQREIEVELSKNSLNTAKTTGCLQSSSQQHSNSVLAMLQLQRVSWPQSLLMPTCHIPVAP